MSKTSSPSVPVKKNKKSLLKVAHVSKVHGIKGEVFIRPLNSQAEWPQPIKEIVIGDLLFSVQKYSRHKEGMIFKLDKCQTRQEAEALKSQAVYLSKEIFKSKKSEGFYLMELKSFFVEVAGEGVIGVVDSFQSHSSQDFLLVKAEGKKDLIPVPFAGDYVQEINFSKKNLILNLPENFLDIFS